MSNKFCLVAPMYNVRQYLIKFMYSLAAQSYENWHLVLIDDVSTDNSAREARLYGDRILGGDRITVIENSEKKWEVANVLRGIQEARPDDVVCRIDPDDYLCDLDALRIIDTVYSQTGCDALWTKHRWFDEKRITDFNISGPLPDGADPYKHPWVSSHFKTFRKNLIDGIKDENFRGSDGEYIKRAGDQSIYLPILQVAKKRVFLPLVAYSYRCNMDPQTFQTDDAKFQAAEAEFLGQRGFVA